MLKRGYPTVSDKYNVAGGVVDVNANNPILMGEFVKYASQPGYYKSASEGMAAVGEIAGIALATNVKLAGVWPDDGSTPERALAKEAFNLMVDGFIAMELDPTVSTITQDAVAAVGAKTTDTDIIPGKNYYTAAANSDGAGYLNDGTLKYTLVDTPLKANIATYYELTEVGANASTNMVTPGKQAAVILATGGLTTIDYVATGIVAVPNMYFTGLVDGRLAEVKFR